MKKLGLIITIACIGLTSCTSSNTEPVQEAVARVGSDYLYKADLLKLVPEGTTKEDSLLIVKTYIERWASQKLLIEVADLNLSDTQKQEFERLVRQYKIDLYTNAYLEQLVQTSIDTAITQNEVLQYYQDNKENFRTNSRLVKLRYIRVPAEHLKFNQIKERFFSPKENDDEFWDTYLVQLKGAALNDSVWVDVNQVYQKVSFINPENVDDYLQKGKKVEYKEGEEVYFVMVKDILETNQVSPLEYIQPTIKQVILNRKKLEFIKKIEKEITDDALKKNKYEIYN